MKVRCPTCRQFFDQRHVSETTCARCDRTPVVSAREPAASAPRNDGWRMCECGVDFELPKKPGRPPKRCPKCRMVA